MIHIIPTQIYVPRRQEDMHAFVQYLCQRSCEMLNCELTLVLSRLVFLWVTISISPFIRSTTTLAFRCFVHSNPVKVSNYISYLPSHFFAAFVGFLVIIQEEKRVQIYLISIQRQRRLKLQIWTTLDDLSCQSMRSRNHSMNGQKRTTSPDTHSSPEVFSQKNISSVGDLCPLNSNQSKEMTRRCWTGKGSHFTGISGEIKISASTSSHSFLLYI